MSYSLDRFSGRNGHVTHERLPVAFMQLRDQTTTEAEETATMRARLNATDQQLNASANHSRN
ncbi:hypothetical protein V8C42DRAFT_318906 [Trichoderma barbatum]